MTANLAKFSAIASLVLFSGIAMAVGVRVEVRTELRTDVSDQVGNGFEKLVPFKENSQCFVRIRSRSPIVLEPGDVLYGDIFIWDRRRTDLKKDLFPEYTTLLTVVFREGPVVFLESGCSSGVFGRPFLPSSDELMNLQDAPITIWRLSLGRPF